jgi:SAM-dependent methyltransferase
MTFGQYNKYWDNPFWVDRRKGKRVRDLDTKALEALIDALPPSDGKRVLDLGSGTGGSALAILVAYPTAQLELMGKSHAFLNLARIKIAKAHPEATLGIEFTVREILVTSTVTSEPANVIVSCLIADDLVQRSGIVPGDAYTALYTNALLALRPGGIFIVAVRTMRLDVSEHVALLKGADFDRASTHWLCENCLQREQGSRSV